MGARRGRGTAAGCRLALAAMNGMTWMARNRQQSVDSARDRHGSIAAARRDGRGLRHGMQLDQENSTRQSWARLREVQGSDEAPARTQDPAEASKTTWSRMAAAKSATLVAPQARPRRPSPDRAHDPPSPPSLKLRRVGGKPAKASAKADHRVYARVGILVAA